MRTLITLVCLACTGLLGPLPSVAAQQWTRFRGPNGTGIHPTDVIPAQWTEADYRWKVKLPGIGHSSPVVWGARVFVLSANPDDATRHVLCLDASTGDTLWRKDYASTPHHLHPRNSYASSTPAVDSERVYVAWASPEQLTLRALDHDGGEVWVQDLGPWDTEHGFGSSPIVYEDLVILFNSQQALDLLPDQQPGQSRMMAFDRRTGELRWSTPRTTTRVCYSTPCIYQPSDGPPQLICYNTGDGVFSLDPLTGVPNWSVPVFTMRTVSSPILAGDLVLGGTGSGGGGNYLAAVRIGGEPQEVYRVERQAPYVPTSVAYESLVFLFSDRGFASCIEAADGTLVWRERLTSGFSSSPVLADGKLFCIDEQGDVWVLAASRQFQKLGQNALGEPSRATPAISDGRLFVRTDSQLFCVGGAER